MKNFIREFFAFLICTITSMVGFHIHGSIFWAILDFIFPYFAWIKWLICHEVSMHIIRDTFQFFLT